MYSHISILVGRPRWAKGEEGDFLEEGIAAYELAKVSKDMSVADWVSERANEFVVRWPASSELPPEVQAEINLKSKDVSSVVYTGTSAQC